MQEKPPTRPAARQGQTLPQQGETETQDRVPRAPHERDESADSQGSDEPSAQRIGQQAHQDLVQGRRDTGKDAAMDAAYRKQKEPAKKPGA